MVQIFLLVLSYFFIFAVKGQRFLKGTEGWGWHSATLSASGLTSKARSSLQTGLSQPHIPDLTKPDLLVCLSLTTSLNSLTGKTLHFLLN